MEDYFVEQERGLRSRTLILSGLDEIDGPEYSGGLGLGLVV